MLSIPALPIALLLAASSGGYDAAERWTDVFGRSIAPAGDVDGDGAGDLIVGSPHAGERGRAWIVSGRDGRVLLEIRPPEDVEALGRVVRSMGDLDADAVPDAALYVRTRQSADGGAARGGVLLVSGADGRELRRVLGEPQSGFADSFDVIPDLDGDGHAELVIGAPLDDRVRPDSGAVEVRSSRHGLLLRRWDATDFLRVDELQPAAGWIRSQELEKWQPEHLGWFVTSVGDVNGDGHADIAALARPGSFARSSPSALYVFSAADGRTLATRGVVAQSPPHCDYRQVAAAGDPDRDGHAELLLRDGPLLSLRRIDGWRALHQFTIATEDGAFGEPCANVGDLDGDGVSDFVAASPGHPPLDGMGGTGFEHVWAFSGATGRLLHGCAAPPDVDRFGLDLCRIEDVDGDERADYAVGALRTDPPGAWVFIVSGRTGQRLRSIDLIALEKSE